jgi:superoxide dismutase, Fe-Mn family
MPFTLPPLPYAQDALDPYVSSRTLEFHHGKHHNAYVTTLNKLVDGTPMADESLEAIIQKTFGDDGQRLVFNNAAQVWNHTFFWDCMRKGGGGKPPSSLAARIDEAFGDYDGFRKQFKEAAITQFGSGWAWLVSDGGKLSIMKTPNAENPMCFGKKALLTIDVWEHAYYLDYQNRRPDFVDAFLDHLLDWSQVEKNLG